MSPAVEHLPTSMRFYLRKTRRVDAELVFLFLTTESHLNVKIIPQECFIFATKIFSSLVPKAG